jgi:hypothetical protein
MTKLEVLGTTHNPNGSITIDALENGHRVHETFYGYTEKTALSRFVKERRKLSRVS